MTEKSGSSAPDAPDPALLAATLDSLGDAVLVIDADWCVSYLNRAAEQLVERSRESLLGRDIWGEFPPAVGGPFYRNFHRARDTGEPVHFEEFYEPLGRWFDVRAYPTAGLLVVHFRDVTAERDRMDALRRSEADLAQAQAQAQIGSWRRDVRTGERVWSAEMKRIYGLDPEGPAPATETFLEILQEPYRAEVVHALDRAARDGTPWAGEGRIRQPGGEVRWVLGKIAASHSADGRVTSLHGTGQDITERRQAEDALRAMNERFHRQNEALVALTQRQVLLSVDVQTALREITEVAARTLEVERVSVWRFTERLDAIRCHALHTLSGGLQPVGAELDEAHHPGYFRAMRTNEVIAADDARTDPRTCEFSDNYLAPLGITAMLDAPIHLGGALEGVICHEHVGSVRQWTPDEQTFAVSVANLISLVLEQAGRREAEKRLRRQASLLDQAHDAIMMRDLDHRILYWSRGAERVYGWTRDEVLGVALTDRLYDDPAIFHGVIKQLLAKGEWAGELQHRTRSGQPITVFARWSLVHDASGQPEAVLAINTDITERRQLEQQFLRAQRLESIGTLAGGIAHDLNNVLAPILMSVELLRMTDDDPARLDTLATIEASARRGADMVRQVLTFARGVSGRRVEVRIADLLRDVARMVEETFLKGITLRVHSAKDLWPVVGDATQLHQVLINLAVNARDAMPNGGTLTLAAENVRLDEDPSPFPTEAAPGPYVRITVEDTGTGMTPAVMDRLFEPFFTTKEQGKGTGLGLATSRAIVKSHGGFIHVHSEPGQGTTFRVCLPAQPEGVPAVVAPLPVHLPRGNGELILVVDDEAAIRQVTQHALEAFGYRVVVAADGTEAVARHAEHRDEIALVLSDMMMPGMDGLATIRLLQEMTPGLRAVLASGLAGHGNRAQAAEAGIQHFLAKPFTVEELVTTVREALDG
ncbi:MAG: PAS domain S-box protein [Gemmatimonadales bacterium]